MLEWLFVCEGFNCNLIFFSEIVLDQWKYAFVTSSLLQIHIQPVKTSESTSSNIGGDHKLEPEQKLSCEKLTDPVNSVANLDVSLKPKNTVLLTSNNSASMYSVKNEPFENSDIEDDPLEASQIVTCLLTADHDANASPKSSRRHRSKIQQTQVDIRVRYYMYFIIENESSINGWYR